MRVLFDYFFATFHAQPTRRQSMNHFGTPHNQNAFSGHSKFNVLHATARRHVEVVTRVYRHDPRAAPPHTAH